MAAYSSLTKRRAFCSTIMSDWLPYFSMAWSAMASSCSRVIWPEVSMAWRVAASIPCASMAESMSMGMPNTPSSSSRVLSFTLSRYQMPSSPRV